MVDVTGVKFDDFTGVNDYDTLTKQFSKKYYSNNYLPYDQIVDHSDDMVYSLIYGNDNNDLLPDDELNAIRQGGWSNNKTERIFGGHKTIVFLHTHHPYQWEKAKEGWTKELKQNNLSSCQNIYDICLIMEAKRKLKAIQRTLNAGKHSIVKDALASISGYMNTNPYHLGEMGRKVKYLYQAMGVTDLLASVKDQGILQADAIAVRENRSVNYRMLMLTIATVALGTLQLLQNIQNKNSTDMPNCDCGGVSIQIDCCTIMCVLLFILTVCVVAMLVNQVKHGKRVDEICDRLKKFE